MVGYNVPLQKKTRPDTGLRQSRAGGQEPYLRSLDHLGRSSEVKDEQEGQAKQEKEEGKTKKRK